MNDTGSWSGRRRSFPPRTARTILTRDAHTCQLQYPGCLGRATEADHVVGHADATAAGWSPEDIEDPANGQAVCKPCHREKTLAEIARGIARAHANGTLQRPTRTRPKKPHPGIINT